MGETYQLVNFENHGTSVSAHDTRFHLLQHLVKGSKIVRGKPNDGILRINVKFVSKCYVFWIKVHASTDTIVEVSEENVPLEGDLCPARGILASVLFQSNGNNEAYWI